MAVTVSEFDCSTYDSDQSVLKNKTIIKSELNMEDFTDSFNVVFGFNYLPDNFNVLDNDYFTLKAFQA